MNADVHAHEAGRLLARARWAPEARLDRAVTEVVTRAGELTGEQLAELRTVTGQREDAGDE